MIYIESFTHRLGNQLFQLAAAIGLAKKYDGNVFFPDWYYSKDFEGDFYSADFMHQTDYRYHELAFHYNEIPYVQNMSINGYFQSEKYFQHCKKHIKTVFKPKPVSTDIHIEPNACFIHVRRGDYVNLTHFHPLKTWDNYYAKAVERMDVHYPSMYYIFSDDIDMVKSEFPENKMFEYINGGNEMIDFYLMTKCKYQIIGNSSFSWWASYLSEYKETQTVAPKDWFGPGYSQHNLKDLYPQSWMVI